MSTIRHKNGPCPADDTIHAALTAGRARTGEAWLTQHHPTRGWRGSLELMGTLPLAESEMEQKNTKEWFEFIAIVQGKEKNWKFILRWLGWREIHTKACLIRGFNRTPIQHKICSQQNPVISQFCPSQSCHVPYDNSWVNPHQDIDIWLCPSKTWTQIQGFTVSESPITWSAISSNFNRNPESSIMQKKKLPF